MLVQIFVGKYKCIFIGEDSRKDLYISSDVILNLCKFRTYVRRGNFGFFRVMVIGNVRQKYAKRGKLRYLSTSKT